MSVKVAVTELEFRKAEAYFRSVPDFEFVVAPAAEEELAAAIRASGARHAIVGDCRYAGELYRALPPGGVIARFGTGCDGIDPRLARQHRLFCTNTPGVSAVSVAEFTIGLMVAAARHLAACLRDTRDGVWRNRVGAELSGKRLLIVGCGPIGLATARIAAFGLNMRVAGCGRRPLAEPERFGLDRFTLDINTMLPEADFVSLHIPDTPENHDFINAARLRCCKPSAILINTARGGVIDENALYDAIASGRLAGAALDVCRTEPYRPQDAARDLRTLDRVLLSPHLGSSTVEAGVRVAHAALDNIRAAEAGDIGRMSLVE